MATPRKALEFVVETELDANYSALLQAMLGNLSLDQLSKGDKEGALVTEMTHVLTGRLRTKLIEGVMKVIAEQLTDDELDHLIEIYKLPVSAKMRSLLPDLSQEVIAMFSDGRIDVDAMVKELIAEME